MSSFCLRFDTLDFNKEKLGKRCEAGFSFHQSPMSCREPSYTTKKNNFSRFIMRPSFPAACLQREPGFWRVVPVGGQVTGVELVIPKACPSGMIEHANRRNTAGEASFRKNTPNLKMRYLKQREE